MSNTFEHLGLPDQMMAALTRMNFTTPTPIQSRTIPVAMQGRDILGSAQTGTGKTGAFCIPMIAKLMADEKAMALVVTPTRELASQILAVVHSLTSNNRAIRTALLIGGDSMGKQFGQLRDRPRIIVGTPGRINDHLRRNPQMLEDVVFVAIDEADRMLDMGFSVQLDEILRTLPAQRQTLMFSATFPEAIVRFSRSYLNNPERIAVNPESAVVPKIKHEIKRTTDANKYTDLLAELEARDGTAIIFVKTQHGTDRLAKRLENDNHAAVAIHGGLRQNQREKAVREFRAQRFRILVATDVASRGLDVPHVEHVLNYDLPQVAEDYIHRIGRTGRAGAEGNAMAFVLPSDGQMWNAINRLMNPGEKPERFERSEARPNRGGGNRSGGFKSGGYQGGQRSEGRSDFRSNERGDFKPREDRKFPSRDGRPVVSGNRFEGPRPDGNRAEGNARPEGAKPFVKYYNKDAGRSSAAPSGGERKTSDRNWNHKDNRAKYNAADGKFEQPRRDNEARTENRDGRSEPRGENRSFAAKPPYKKDDRARSGNDRPSGERSDFRRDDRPAHVKPEGFRSDRRDDRSTAFKTGPDGKPKSAKPGAKKPFQFKEHTRKPDRKVS